MGQKLLGRVSTVTVLRGGQLCSPRDEAACPGEGGEEPAGLAAVARAQPREEPRPEAERTVSEREMGWKAGSVGRGRGREPAGQLLPTSQHSGLGYRTRKEGGRAHCTQLALCPQESTSRLQASPQWSPPLPNAMVSPPAVSTPGGEQGEPYSPGSETPILHARLPPARRLETDSCLGTVLSRFETDVFLPQKQAAKKHRRSGRNRVPEGPGRQRHTLAAHVS